jgi:hypothetical protein
MPNNPEKLRMGGRLGTPETDAEKAAKQVATAMDSVNLINDLIAAGDRADQKLDTVRRNVEHLKIVVARDVVKNSTEDLAPLHAAIAAGGSYLAASAS